MPAKPVTYYEILGVGHTATGEQIKSAYRQIMKRHHPDVHRDQSDPLSRLAIEAYTVLGDSQKRAQYDAGLSVSKGKPERPAPTPPSSRPVTVKPQPAQPKKPPRSTGAQPVSQPTTGVRREMETCTICQGRGTFGGFPFKKKCDYCFGEKLRPAAPAGYQLCSKCKGWGYWRPALGGIMFIKGFDYSSGSLCDSCHGTGLARLDVYA